MTFLAPRGPNATHLSTPAGGYCYHVLNRGNAHAEVFHKEADFQAFLEILAVGVAAPPDAASGLLSDTQPLPPGPLAGPGRRPEPVDALATDHSWAPLPKALPLQRAHLARPLQVVSNPGRRPSPGRAALHRAEPLRAKLAAVPRTGPGPASKRCRTRPRRRCGSIPARRRGVPGGSRPSTRRCSRPRWSASGNRSAATAPWVTRPGRWRPRRTWAWNTACIPGVVRPGSRAE